VTLRRIETALPGVVLLEPRTFRDERGFFFESYRADHYAAAGVVAPFVQDNFSRSVHGTLRGLHFQEPQSQGKLVQVLRGRVFDVAVDVRVGSPTFAKWMGVELSDEEPRQMWIPPGFAHGFCVLSDWADFFYKCTDYYAPACEKTIAWNDPAIGIEWPIAEPRLSPKDAAASPLGKTSGLPRF
jgi:dTDP-4-dehydrorhamnose 3,5-epimerase